MSGRNTSDSPHAADAALRDDLTGSAYQPAFLIANAAGRD